MRILALVTLAVVSVAFVALGSTSAPPNLGKAIEAQRQLAKELPRDAQVLNDLGNLLTLAGNLPEARASYEAAIELDAELPAARYNLGLLLQQLGERRQALSEFKKVLKIQPDNAWAHFQAAMLHEAGGNDSAAVEHYAKAFRLDPQLSFHEVNPQIIDSKLVTQSLLLAHRDRANEASAPRDYAQPSRIVKLMVAPKAAPAELAPEAPPADATAPAAVAPERAPRPQAAGTTPSAPRTLRAEDLEAERGAAGSAGSTRRGGSRVTPPPPSGPTGNFTRPRIAPGVQPGPPPEPPRYTPPPAYDETDDSGDDGYDVEGDQEVIAPSGGQRLQFIPGIQSSGRLEMKLVPDPPPAG